MLFVPLCEVPCWPKGGRVGARRHAVQMNGWLRFASQAGLRTALVAVPWLQSLDPTR